MLENCKSLEAPLSVPAFVGAEGVSVVIDEPDFPGLDREKTAKIIAIITIQQIKNNALILERNFLRKNIITKRTISSPQPITVFLLIAKSSAEIRKSNIKGSQNTNLLSFFSGPPELPLLFSS